VFQRWEQLVVSKLKWDLSAVTPGDFLLYILARLPIDPRSWDSGMVLRHAQTFIALSARGESSMPNSSTNSSTNSSWTSVTRIGENWRDSTAL
jgi:hypothetical protein